MNWYEHHINDYAEATAHLTFVEDAAYSRCLRKYYAKEAALPGDVKAVQRLVGARTTEERTAVETVLKEFFELRDDGCWHQDRCDEVIAAYQAGEPEREAGREAKRANHENRLRKHREERARLFQALAQRDQHPPWNIKISALRALHTRFCCSPETKTETSPATPETLPATVSGPITATAETAKPIPSSQFPVPTPQVSEGEVDISSESETPVAARRAVACVVDRAKAAGLMEPEAFTQLRSIYPQRTGRQRWDEALAVFEHRLGTGWTADAILEVAGRYAAFCKATKKTGTETVMQVLSFLLSDEALGDRWEIPKSKPQQRQDENVDASVEWLRTQEAKDAAG